MSGNMPTQALHKEVCTGCQMSIEDKFLLKVMENSWHETCLNCAMCQLPLSGSCFVRDRKLYCRADYDKLFGTKCNGCLQPIPANELVMRAAGYVYHLRCFMCMACGHQLQKGDEFVVKEGQLFCRLDFEKEFSIMPMSPKSDCSDFCFDDRDSRDSKGPKRPRTILNTSQRRKFKAAFELNPKPCRKVREALAAETGLSVRVVQVWFQNQRAKVKKIARKQNVETNNNNGESKKSKKSSKRKSDDDSDSSDCGGNNDSDEGISSLPPMSDGQHYNTIHQYDNQGPLYNGQTIHDSMYPDTPMDESDSLDHMLMADSVNHNTLTSNLINPIDKLYSMHNSYFE